MCGWLLAMKCGGGNAKGCESSKGVVEMIFILFFLYVTMNAQVCPSSESNRKPLKNKISKKEQLKRIITDGFCMSCTIHAQDDGSKRKT